MFSERRLATKSQENPPSPKTRAQVLRDVAAIAAPVLGACLVEPALTMIDTWFVGRLRPPPARAAVLGLAALSANCSLFNLLTTALSFFCTATAGMVARGVAAGDTSAARRALTHGAYLSAIVGTVLGATLLLFARPILTVPARAGTEGAIIDGPRCRSVALRTEARRDTESQGGAEGREGVACEGEGRAGAARAGGVRCDGGIGGAGPGGDVPRDPGPVAACHPRQLRRSVARARAVCRVFPSRAP